MVMDDRKSVSASTSASDLATRKKDQQFAERQRIAEHIAQALREAGYSCELGSGQTIRRDNWVSSVRRLQSLLDTAKQMVLAKRFVQETNRTGLHGAHSDIFVAMRRYENYRDGKTSGDQSVLQVKAAQSWHLKVRYHARAIVDFVWGEEIFGWAERQSLIAQWLHEHGRRLARAPVVIDNRNGRNDLRQARKPVAELLDVALSGPGSIQVDLQPLIPYWLDAGSTTVLRDRNHR
jgi:hypothetical protein